MHILFDPDLNKPIIKNHYEIIGEIWNVLGMY